VYEGFRVKSGMVGKCFLGKMGYELKDIVFDSTREDKRCLRG